MFKKSVILIFFCSIFTFFYFTQTAYAKDDSTQDMFYFLEIKDNYINYTTIEVVFPSFPI